jgi:hypothetical protein
MRKNAQFAAFAGLALALGQCLGACSGSGASNLFSDANGSGGGTVGGLSSGGTSSSGASALGGAGGAPVGGGGGNGGAGGAGAAPAGGVPGGGMSGAATGESAGTSGSGGSGGESATGGSGGISNGGAGGSGGGGGTLLISQIKTRGIAGAADEFVEIYNPTGAAIAFDASWSVSVRTAVVATTACAMQGQVSRFVGSGQSIPSHGHLLITGTGYNGAAASDGQLLVTVQDAGSLLLEHGNSVVDAVCFYYNATTDSVLTACSTPYTCEGTPVSNLPHDNTGAGNIDASIERKPGGAAGNATDTNDNATDFEAQAPSEPRGLASPVTN